MSVTCAKHPPYSYYDVATIIAPFPAEYLWSTQIGGCKWAKH